MPQSRLDVADDAAETHVVSHPLESLTPGEIRAAARRVRAVMAELGDHLRFETIELKEPSKAAVREHRPGMPITREARVTVYRAGDIGVWCLVVSLTSDDLVSKHFVPDARPMIQLEEFLAIEALVKADVRFVEACARRGIHDLDLVCVDPWSAGYFGAEGEEGRHLSHAFVWMRTREDDNLYAHPVEGLNPVIDIKRMEVIRVDDYGKVPVPLTEHNYDPRLREGLPLRDDLRPIDVTQPEGVSFQIIDDRITWHDWSVLVGFNARESLTLHDISYRGRPVLYRASLAEMVVPYGSPDNAHYRKNVFDIGEYGIGKLTNSLELGCDCLGAIAYLDGWLSDINGEPMRMPNAICIHEEDAGILWKHWDFRSDRTEVRRARRLVISSIATVGNYEYGMYWYFHLDGTIEFEVKATGIINTAACHPGEFQRYGTEVAPGIVGQIHQHQFCARLDLSIDGDRNSVLECDTQAVPAGPDNPHGNAFYVEETLLDTESGRERNPETERYWKFINPETTNAMGQPPAYRLHPTNSVRSFVDPDSPSGRRMAFVGKQLWVTPYASEERYPAGEFVNHSDGSDGLAAYTSQARSIENTDIVAWHVFGLHHLPRLEDFPVQPVATTGFKLVPSGFSATNPTLDLPGQENGASCHADVTSDPRDGVA